MDSDRDICQFYDECYDEAYQIWNPFYAEADTDTRFYLGDQWTQAEKAALHEEGRKAYTFNRTYRVINAFDGFQRQNRSSIIATPRDGADPQTADDLSAAILNVMSRQNGYNTISDCNKHAWISGFNLMGYYLDYRDDPLDGDIKFSREPWNSFIVDPYFTKMDLSDCAYLMRRKYIHVEQAMSLVGKSEGREIEELSKTGFERDSKFTWLPYQRQPAARNMVAYDEFYVQKWVSKNVIIDRESGEMTDFDGTEKQFALLKANFPELDMIKRKKKEIHWHIIVNNKLIRTEVNPYGINEYPFIPFMCIWMPECDQWDLKCQSLSRLMRDPQREANRRRSQFVDLCESQINTGFIAEVDSVVNPKSLYQAGQGRVVWKNKNLNPGAIERINPVNIPPGFFQTTEIFDRDIYEIPGMNDAAFGDVSSANESGLMQLIRQSASLVNVQGLMDNLRLSQKHVGERVMRLLQNMSPEKIERLIGRQPTEEFFSREFSKYEIAVQEGVLTDTQQQMFFRQLIDLSQIVPIPPELLAEAAPLQGKSEYNRRIKEYQEQQAEAQAQQQQMEQQLMQAQMDLATSKSIEQVAGAKERFTRSVANMGLEDERSSEAVQNRTQAVLDQARAIAELKEINIRNAAEEMRLAALLREQNRLEEEQFKSDNVQIADQISNQGMSNEENEI